MNDKFTDEIALIETQIAGADTRTATFEELLVFSRSLLVDIATAWERPTLTRNREFKIFPNGLKYHPEKGF